MLELSVEELGRFSITQEQETFIRAKGELPSLEAHESLDELFFKEVVPRTDPSLNRGLER